jgi:hypothetical protein
MEDRETPRMHKYGETKTTRIMMALVRHMTSSSGIRKFQAAWFLLNRVYVLPYHLPDVILISKYWLNKHQVRRKFLNVAYFQFRMLFIYNIFIRNIKVIFSQITFKFCVCVSHTTFILYLLITKMNPLFCICRSVICDW